MERWGGSEGGLTGDHVTRASRAGSHHGDGRRGWGGVGGGCGGGGDCYSNCRS